MSRQCQTLQYSSNGFQLTSKTITITSSNKVHTGLRATLIGDTDPATTHGVGIILNFACGLFRSKCCVDYYHTENYIGEKQVTPPKTEPIECFSARDVSKENCDSYDPGWCGMHIRQYQRNEGPGFQIANYRFDVYLYDADQELVGERDLISIPTGQTYQVGSTLPYTFGVTAPEGDDDPVIMHYNGQKWGSNSADHQCKFGAFSSGHRDGDCGFSC